MEQWTSDHSVCRFQESSQSEAAALWVLVFSLHNDGIIKGVTLFACEYQLYFVYCVMMLLSQPHFTRFFCIFPPKKESQTTSKVWNCIVLDIYYCNVNSRRLTIDLAAAYCSVNSIWLCLCSSQKVLAAAYYWLCYCYPLNFSTQ